MTFLKSFLVALLLTGTSFAASGISTGPSQGALSRVRALEATLIKGTTGFQTKTSCTAGGGHCDFASDCCSDNCFGNKCQAGGAGCTAGGGHCDFASSCCSGSCNGNTCAPGQNGCANAPAHCTFDSECCSNNCYQSTCQAGCTLDHAACTYDFECCTGSCSQGSCGKHDDCK